jgi:hypothetical protein
MDHTLVSPRKMVIVVGLLAIASLVVLFGHGAAAGFVHVIAAHVAPDNMPTEGS